MKRWLADFRVQSDLRLKQGETSLNYIDPQDGYNVKIKDIGGTDGERLSVEIVFEAQDIAAAESQAKDHIQKFLNLLSFVTSYGFRVTRKIALIDWQPGGTGIREAYVYGPSDRADELHGLSASLLNTVEMLKSWGTTPLLETALRWYASGVRSSIMEDQFQLFWYVIEVIGVSTASAKVVDKCVRCGGELCCSNCGAISEHRPFEKQKISAMLSQGGIHQPLIDNLFYVRNALLHGTPREEIEIRIREKDQTFSFDKIVDFAGWTAWQLILQTFKMPPGEHRPNFLQVNTYVDWQVTAKAHVKIGIPGHPNNPQYNASILPKVWIQHGPGELKPPA